MSRRARLIATVLCVAVFAAVGLGVAVHWYIEQWDPQGQRQVTAAARAVADAAVRQAELGVPAHGEPTARARVLDAYGRVLSISGDTEHATFVVEIHPAGNTATPGVPATKCFRIEFDAWRGHVDKSLRCPDHGTEISLPPPPTTLPSLGDYIDDVRRSMSGLPPSVRRDPPKVEAAIAAIVGTHGATVEVSSADSVLGAAIRRDQDHDCVFVRIADDVEIWRPESVYRLYGRTGETRCTSAGAIARAQQQAPH